MDIEQLNRYVVAFKAMLTRTLGMEFNLFDDE